MCAVFVLCILKGSHGLLKERASFNFLGVSKSELLKHLTIIYTVWRSVFACNSSGIHMRALSDHCEMRNDHMKRSFTNTKNILPLTSCVRPLCLCRCSPEWRWLFPHGCSISHRSTTWDKKTQAEDWRGSQDIHFFHTYLITSMKDRSWLTHYSSVRQ